MMNNQHRHADKRFAFSLSSPESTKFGRVCDHLVNTVLRAAMRARTECAIANDISVFETEAFVTPDPDHLNVVTVTARPLAIVDPFAESES